MNEANPIDSIGMRYRCCWCGAPTNELGYVLPDIPKEYLPLWNGAISVTGKCCETDIRNQEEHEQLAKLDKYQKRYLSRRCCGLCDHPIDKVGCGSFYEACPEQTRIDRRDNCLRKYKPRLNRRAT